MAKRKKIEFDATDQAPGRLASRIAPVLMGKHKPGYLPHRDSGDRAVVKNVEKMVFSGKKIHQKLYRHHSMHPGGLKEMPANKLFKENPREILRHAVEKMLPKNKLRGPRLRRLIFS